MQSADKINYVVLLPAALDQLKGNDASFETATSSSIQTLKLYYVFKVAIKSLGLVFYHNGIYIDGKIRADLQNRYDVVVPSAKMLEIALKLDQVHTFGDMSLSQVIEKMDSVTERISTGQKSAHGEREQNLVVIISLAEGFLVETE